MKDIKKRAVERGIFTDVLERMFLGEELVPTLIGRDVAALVWLSEKVREHHDEIIDLVDEFHFQHIAMGKGTIHIPDWVDYLREKGNDALAEIVEEEAGGLPVFLK